MEHNLLVKMCTNPVQCLINEKFHPLMCCILFFVFLGTSAKINVSNLVAHFGGDLEIEI